MRLLPLIAIAFLAACSRPAETVDGEPVETSAEADAPQPLTAAHVADLIAADGAAHTLAVLSGPGDPTGIQKVFAGVATGATDWLAVGQSFRPVADGYLAEGLSDAFNQALLKNASGVLAALKATGGASELTCAADDAAAVAAVTAVTEPDLQTVKQECLGYMSGPIEG